MNDILTTIRQLFLAGGFQVDDAPEKVPPGGLVARRGTTNVIVYVTDSATVPNVGITQRVLLTSSNKVPAKDQIAATAEVPGLRQQLVVER